MLNRVTASFDNGKPLDILAASFAADTGGYCWQCSVTLPPDSFARLNMDGRDKGKEAVITVEASGHTFAFIAEEYGDTRRFGQKDYTVSGRSLTAYLGADYGKPGSGTYQNAVYARQIADAQLEFSGFKVIGWHIPDWLVAGGSYAVTGKTPMAVLQELAKAAGGFVESDPHLPVVRIKPRWPKAAWQIAEAGPDATVPSSVILQINGRRTVSERCNGVFVWAEHAKGRAGDVYRQGGSREPRAAALTDTLYTDTDVLTAAGMAALSDTGIHKTETVQMPVSEKYGIPLAQLGQVWQIQEPEGHWQGVITGITLTVESENTENHTKRGHRPLYGQIRERLKMNVLQRLNAVLDRKSTGVAKITGHLGGNAWAAQSQTGGNLILTGEAEMGGRVFYDQHTNRITGRAPDLAVTDLPLV